MSEPLEFWHHHGALSVPDLDASIAWWRDVLGFCLVRRFPIHAIPAQVAILSNGPLSIELFEVPHAAPLPAERRLPDSDVHTHGNKHIAFAVHSVESFAAELRHRGADIVWVKHMQHGSNIFIRDNAGNLIEFVQERRSTDATASLSRSPADQ